MQLFAKILPLLFWDLQIVFAALFKSITCNFTSKLNDCTQRKSGKEPPTGCRSSRPEMFCKKVVLRNFAKFTGKHLCQSFFFDKVAGQIHRKTPVPDSFFICRPEACNFINKKTLAEVFSCEFCKISTNILSNKTPLMAASRRRFHQILKS